MRYELVHDTLARQILDRVSAEAKARRRAELLVARAYERYTERRVLLTQDDLDEIRPHEQAINFSREETAFIQESKLALERIARRRRRLVIGVITLLSVFLLFALWQWQNALASAKAQRQARLALEARAAYEAGQVSRSFRLAQAAYSPAVDSSTGSTISEVLQQIAASGLERELVMDTATLQLDVDPTEQYILAVSTGRTAYLWDFQGRLRQRMAHPAGLLGGRFIAWNRQQFLLTIARDSSAYFWDGAGQLIRKYSLSEPIKGFDLNANNHLILLWGDREVVLIAESGEDWRFDDSPDGLIQAGFSPNGQYLLLATPQAVQCHWIPVLTRGNSLSGFKNENEFVIPGLIRWAGFVRSDQIQQQVLIQYVNGPSRIYDRKGKVDTSSYYRHLNRELALIPPVSHFAFSYPGHAQPKTLFLTDSTSVYYWSAYRKNKAGEQAGNVDFYTRYDAPVIGTAFSTSDRFLLTASADGRVDIWDISGFAAERHRRFRAQVRQAYFTQDDRYLVTTSGNNAILIWNLKKSLKATTAELLDHYDKRLQQLDTDL